MSGCIHMDPGEFCAACAPEKLRGALHELSLIEADTQRGATYRSTPIFQRVRNIAEHERQTHERLGAILGTDTSLEDAARRMRDRAEAAEQERDAYKRAKAENDERFLGERDEARAKYADALTVLRWMGARYDASGNLTIHPDGWNAAPDAFDAWRRIRGDVEAQP